jgi:hypothetical protein
MVAANILRRVKPMAFFLSGARLRIITPGRSCSNVLMLWQIAKLGGTAKTGCNRGMTNVAGPAVGSTPSRLIRITDMRIAGNTLEERATNEAKYRSGGARSVWNERA